MKLSLKAFIAPVLWALMSIVPFNDIYGQQSPPKDTATNTKAIQGYQSLTCIFRDEANIIHTTRMQHGAEIVTDTYFFTDSTILHVEEIFNRFATYFPALISHVQDATPHSYNNADEAYTQTALEVSEGCSYMHAFSEDDISKMKGTVPENFRYPYLYTQYWYGIITQMPAEPPPGPKN